MLAYTLAAFKEGEIMKRGLGIVMAAVCLGLGASALWQQPVFASSETATYQLHMEAPQIAQAANGDIVSITGSGVFSVNPKTVSATGTFTSQSSGSGTWVATQLLDFQPYGCGIIFGTPIPPNLCGGKLMLRVVLTDSTSGQQFDGVLWVSCVIGPNPPNSVQEGARLDIVGINNFNKIVSGDNVYVKTS
jgi:hypothetical protein